MSDDLQLIADTARRKRRALIRHEVEARAEVRRVEAEKIAKRKEASTRVYAAADVNRLTADWFTSILSADQELKGDLRRIRGAARSLVRDNPYAARYVQMLAENVVGHQGIQLQVRLGTTRGTVAQASQDIEDEWKAWACDPKASSADGRLTWTETLLLMVKALASDGEVLLRHVRGVESEYGYAVQVLDPDLLDVDLGNASPVILPNGNLIVMGVEMEPRYRRPVAYWLHSTHPSESGALVQKRDRVAVQDIEHLYIQMRPGQTRGVPWFAPVMLAMKMRGAFEEAAINAARVGASSGYGITVDPDKAILPNGAAFPSPGTTGVPHEVEPGLVPRFAPGELPVPLPMDYPSGEMAPFLQQIDLSIGAGLNVTRASLTGNLSDANFSSLRAGKQSERDFYRVITNFVIDHAVRPVYREWCLSAALMGRIPGRTTAAYLRAAEWIPRGWPFVQPMEDAQANEIAVKNGWKTHSQVCAETGGDFETNITRRAEENAFAEANNVTLGDPVPVVVAPPDENAPDENAPSRALRLARSLER